MDAKRFNWLAALLALAAGANAQGAPKQEGPARIVGMFDVLCLSQLPDLDGVAKAAGFGEFAPITGAELKQYEPAVPAEELRAWSFHDQGGKYVLTAARSKPDDAFKKAVPAFAKSTNVACSLLFPANAPKEALMQAVVRRLGRAPDKSWDEGALRVHAWNGQTDKVLSHVHLYEPAKDGLTGILSASAFVKD